MENLLSMEAMNKNSFAGKRGETLFWSLGEKGDLTLEGRGDMPDFPLGEIPWEGHREEIHSVIIKEGIARIGVETFWGFTNLKSVKLPKSLKIIHRSAFEDCSSLERVEIPGEVLLKHIYEKQSGLKKTILMGSRAFRGTPWAAKMWGDFLIKENVLIEYYGSSRDVVLPENVEEIGSFAFRDVPLSSIVFPQGLKAIRFGAFEKTGLGEIVLPESLEVIEDHAFRTAADSLHVTFETDHVQFTENGFGSEEIVFEGSLASYARESALKNDLKYYTNQTESQTFSDYVRKIQMGRIRYLGSYIENMLKAGHMVFNVVLDDEGKTAKKLDVFAGRRVTEKSVPRSVETFAGGDQKTLYYARWDVEKEQIEKKELLKWSTGGFRDWYHSDYLPLHWKENNIWYVSKKRLAEEQIPEFTFLEMWKEERK